MKATNSISTPYHFPSGDKCFLLKSAFVSVLELAVRSSKKKERFFRYLDHITTYKVKEGYYILYADIPDSIISSLKLDQEDLIRSLKIYDLKKFEEKELKSDLILNILKNSIEDQWIRYLYHYPEYNLERAMALARRHVLLAQYLTLPFSYKEIYEASKSIFSETERWNYNYLTEKLKRIKKGESTIIEELKPKRGNKNGLKFNKDLIDKAEDEYIVEYSTHDEILEAVNSTARTLGYKEIKLSVLKDHFAQIDVQNRLRPFRNGDIWHRDNIEPPIHHEKPKYRDELHEADGSRIQIPYYDREKNEVNFLSVYVILDVASGMVVGYDTKQFEDHEMVIKSFDRMLQIHGYLPRSITTDRAGHYKAKRFQHLKSISKSLGVQWTFSSNPRRKPYVESFFRFFGQQISKRSPGYYGLGITCMNPDSRSERARIRKIIKNKRKLFSKIELIQHVDLLIENYNTRPTKETGVSPSESYHALDLKYSIPVSDLDKIRMTWKSKSTDVMQSEIKIKSGKNKYYFQLNEANGLKYSRDRVRIYFQDDFRYIFCFDQKGGFIEKIKSFRKINPSQATASEADKKRLNKLLQERNTRKNNLKKDISERRKRVKENEAKIIPIEMASAIGYNKSEEYEMHKEFTRKNLAENDVQQRIVNSGGSTLDIEIDRSRLYKPLDDEDI